MSQLDHKTKKRKHPHPAPAEEPSSKRSKTERTKKGAIEAQAQTGAHETQKEKSKSRTHGKDKAGKKDLKGKAKAADSQFSVVNATLALSIPPVFAGNLRAGAEEMLDSMVMRYIPALQGVVLAHDNLRFLDAMASLKADCPFANCRVSFDATVWGPHVGMKLIGKVNLCSPDHVSLLVHRTFNVSIPRHHIPTDHWEFEYGPAENDPEFGMAADADGATAPDGEEQEQEQEHAEAQMEGSGRWVHKITGTKLGAPDGYLEFTVIGLTIANQMLSLVGSIQPDPFSPAHVPDHSIVSTTSAAPRWQPAVAAEDAAVPDAEAKGEGEAESEEEDAFETLGRMGDEAAARKAKEEGEKKERKRKPKEEKAAAKAADADAAQGKKRKKTS